MAPGAKSGTADPDRSGSAVPTIRAGMAGARLIGNAELSDDNCIVLGDAVEGAEKPVDSIAPAREAPDRSASTTADNLQITSFIELGIQD